VASKSIELPSEELAEELQKYLKDRRFDSATYDKARKTIRFPDGMNPAEWSSARSTIEKWARGRNMEVSESMKLQPKQEPAQASMDSKEREAELKKKLDALAPEKAEERYNYLRSKSISELTDAEYEERLALAQTLSSRSKATKDSKG